MLSQDDQKFAKKPTERRDFGTKSLHSIAAERAAEIFGVDRTRGLTEDEAARRLRQDGANTLAIRGERGWQRLLLDQFTSIVVWLLVVAAAISWLTGNHLESAAILVVLALNAAVGFAIEWQAGRALEALKKATRTTARVRREGREEIIDAENLVTGDVIILSAGDKAAADARIFEAVNLRADESTLTGESMPTEKNAAAVAEKTPLAERASMLYLGTTVVAGRAAAIVTATGQNTEIGRIGQIVAAAEEEKTPLEKKLAGLGKRLVYIVLAIAAIVFAAGILRGESLWMMLEVAISLAVAAVPEGLPAVTTLILALGVLRMARQNAIVRRLAAVETLGCTTVICTDKTGTLTENRMTVSEYRLANNRTIRLGERDAQDSVGERGTYLQDEDLLRFLRVGVLCSEASIDSQSAGTPQAIGDPTETALLDAVEKCGFDAAAERAACEKLFEMPFDSALKRMVTVLRDNDGGQVFAAMKGAPGVILERCDRFIAGDGSHLPLTAEQRAEFLKINEEMAARALRVLAFADKDFAEKDDFLKDDNLENGWTFLGFAGMSDPPRAGAAEAVGKAQAAGIRVVMLTGDQVNTARAVARELRLGEADEIYALHASDLSDANGERLAQMARRAHVFARVTPEDKMRLVKALRDTGEIVAVTGDGVNDAPALKYSDIGVAMGMRGTEVAKEASDIVLTDDNFSTIVRAIEGGRTIYANIIKFVHLLFSDNLGEVLVIFAAIMAGLPLPLMPLQILWVNLVTDIFPALALAVEPPSPATMRRRPHSPGESLLSNEFLLLIFWKGLISAGIVLAAYYWALQNYGEGAHARTVALFSLVAVQVANLFNCRSRSRSAFTRFFSNPYIFAAVIVSFVLQFLAIYLPPLARILDTAPLNQTDFLIVGISLILPVAIIETFKAVAGRKHKSR